MEQHGACSVPSSHEIAQLNLARPLEPLTSFRLAGFVELLVPVMLSPMPRRGSVGGCRPRTVTPPHCAASATTT
jgi:hypothetical protein